MIMKLIRIYYPKISFLVKQCEPQNVTFIRKVAYILFTTCFFNFSHCTRVYQVFAQQSTVRQRVINNK